MDDARVGGQDTDGLGAVVRAASTEGDQTVAALVSEYLQSGVDIVNCWVRLSSVINCIRHELGVHEIGENLQQTDLRHARIGNDQRLSHSERRQVVWHQSADPFPHQRHRRSESHGYTFVHGQDDIGVIVHPSKILFRHIKNVIMRWQRLLGHPFGQAVVFLRQPGTHVEIALHAQDTHAESGKIIFIPIDTCKPRHAVEYIFHRFRFIEGSEGNKDTETGGIEGGTADLSDS